MNRDAYDQNYIEFHSRLLNAFIEKASHQFSSEPMDSADNDKDFLAALQQLPELEGTKQLIQGQALLCRIVAGYPSLMIFLPRDLLWFFGGDCLHFMPDDEISIFQALDDQRQSASEANRPFSYEQARAIALGLH